MDAVGLSCGKLDAGADLVAPVQAGAACAAAMPAEIPSAVWVDPRGDVHRPREHRAPAG